MSDLISRQDAIDEIKALYEWHDTVTEDRAVDHLKRLPSAEPKTGEWDDIGGFIRWGCPFCHHAYESRSKFCPNYGARMKGADDEAADDEADNN